MTAGNSAPSDARSEQPPARERHAINVGRVSAGVLWSLCGGIAVLSVSGFLGRWWWVLDLTSHFRVQYLVAAGLLALAAAIWRRWKLMSLAICCTLVNLCLIAPFYLSGAVASPSTPTLRLMSVNVNAANHRKAAVLETIKFHRPDVVFVLEYTQFWQQALAPLESKYGYTRQAPQEDSFGMAMYSRLPVDKVDLITLGQPGFWAIDIQLHFAGLTWSVTGVHVMPPVSARASRLRNDQFAELADRLAQRAAPRVVVGDFNCTPWSPYFHDLLSASGLRDSGRGFGVQPTWPTQLPMMLIPIDHGLVSPGVQVVDRCVAGGFGSDHRALVIELAPGE